MKHTPGPWTYELKPLAKNPFAKEIEYETKENYYSVKAGLGHFSFKETIDTGFDACTYMSEANAKLIAAAPELLESLKELFDLLEKHEPLWYLRGHYSRAKEAIKKATE